MHRVVIIGGGFGGLRCTQALAKAPVDITLIDRRNHHLFQPLLYQVATGGLSPANIAAPLRGVLKRQHNVTVWLGEFTHLDPEHKRAILADGEAPYDTLVIATGSRTSYFGHDAWQPVAPGLKDIEDATEIRRRIYTVFEQAERTVDPEAQRRLLTIVVVGGGPTGVELAGAIAEIATRTLREDFRRINPSDARIILLEGGDRILPTYPASLSAKASRSLQQLGVQIRCRALVTDVAADSVTLRCETTTERIPSHTVLWAAGVAASPIGMALELTTGAKIDRSGRVQVEPDLTIAGQPDIFVIGDLAYFAHGLQRPLPGIAPVAMRQGDYVAGVIKARLRGVPHSEPFLFRERGNMATIGRARAVVDMWGLRYSGFAAWLTWLFVHLALLIQHGNRLLVLIQWAWNYLTHGRSARLIVGRKPTEPDRPPRGQAP